MTDRNMQKDRLTELIGAVQSIGVKYTHEETASSMGFRGNAELADYLLANGVIVPPCKVGDKVWELYTQYNGKVRIREGKISMLQQKADKSWKFRITINSSVWDFTPDKIGTRYFLTKEQAEEKLKELG